jgi:predicted metal-dependent phosphoesterase TrpH
MQPRNGGGNDERAGWKRADLHLHTSFSGWRSLGLVDAQDCYVSPDAAFAAARARGMDFVCFTDHNTIEGALDFLSRHPEEEERVIVGEEVEARFPDSSEWIHINVLDVDEAFHADLTRLRGNCFELVAELRRRGRLFVLNHPFQSFRSIATARRRLAEVLPLFPAVEVCNGTSPRSHSRVLGAMLRHDEYRGTVRLGGSDAHTCAGIASVHTAAPASSKAEFLGCLRSGACAIGGQARGGAALVCDVYVIVGQYYARLYTRPFPMSARRLKNLVCATALLPAAIAGVPALVTTLQVARQEWIARFGPWARRPAPAQGSLPALTEVDR